MNKDRHIKLTPDWRAYFWYYLAGILLIPLFGAGLIILWLTHKKRTSHRYEIHDDLIRWHKQGSPVKIDLLDINDISVNQSFTDKKFGIGTVTLAATVSQIKLFGMKNPHELAGMIREAVHAEEKRQRDLSRQKPREPEYDPGTLEKMNYLTGLWQQGLISDEDYEKERKHFE